MKAILLLTVIAVALGLATWAEAAPTPNIERCLDSNARVIVVGEPCPPFKNRQKVIARVKALLIYNGFRPAMKFYDVSPRQFRFGAFQDGVYCVVTVVKIAPRTVYIRAEYPDAGEVDFKRLTLKFDA